MSETTAGPNVQAPAKEPKRPKLRWVLRQTRRLIVLVSVVLLIFVVGFTIYAWQINVRGNAAVLEIENQLSQRGLLDLYWSDSNTNEEDSYPDATNAKYWEAVMKAVPDAGDRPLLSAGTVWTNSIDYKQQFHTDTITGLREVFEAHPLFLELVDHAIAAPPGRFELGTDLSDPMRSLEILGQSRSVARWLEERSRLAQIDNDGDAYVHAITAILELSDLLSQEPQIMTGLVSDSMDAIARHAVMDGLSRITLSTEHLDQLIDAFQKRREAMDVLPLIAYDLSWQYHLVTTDVQSYLRLLEAKQSLMIRQFSEQEPDWIDTSQLPGPFRQFWKDIFLATCHGQYELKHAKIVNESLGYYDKLKELNSKPKQRWAWITVTLDQIEKRDIDETRELYYARDMTGNNVLVTTRSFLLMESNLASCVAALQVERYRVSNGRWPATLTDATGELPIDAFGEALRYRPTTDGVMVYNVGYNTLDEQGYGQDNRDVQGRYLDADDWPFSLYNPNQRNTIPPPAVAIEPEGSYDWLED